MKWLLCLVCNEMVSHIGKGIVVLGELEGFAKVYLDLWGCIRKNCPEIQFWEIWGCYFLDLSYFRALTWVGNSILNIRGYLTKIYPSKITFFMLLFKWLTKCKIWSIHFLNWFLFQVRLDSILCQCKNGSRNQEL